MIAGAATMIVPAPRAIHLVLLFLVSASLFAVDASAAAAAGANSSFVLAAAQTHRKDPLDGLRHYTGGWNISDDHYWASVGFTAAPVFAAAGVWFVVFGIALFFAACCFCCCPGRARSYSRACLAISLLLLLAVTAAAAVGCAVLYDGQGRFHGSTSATVDYVVRQSRDTVGNLRSFTDYLETAKAVGVGPVTLPNDVKGKIDDVVFKVSAASDELAARTFSNAAKIRTGLETVVVGDTCVAMGEWVQNPQAHTALDDILPCVDTAAATEALNRSKEVNYQLVDVLNTALSNVSNGNAPPQLSNVSNGNAPPQLGPPLYYNQSGPPVPLLCNPYTPDLRDRKCTPGEVTADTAQQEWQRYVCQTRAEVCTTAGRVTPTMYAQLVSAANVSYGLAHYGPVLVDLADCTFVRETFRSIGADHCPGLRRYSGQVFRGMLGASVAVMLAVLLWMAHAREQRRRREAKELVVRPAPTYQFHHVEERALLKSPMRPYK